MHCCNLTFVSCFFSFYANKCLIEWLTRVENRPKRWWCARRGWTKKPVISVIWENLGTLTTVCVKVLNLWKTDYFVPPWWAKQCTAHQTYSHNCGIVRILFLITISDGTWTTVHTFQLMAERTGCSRPRRIVINIIAFVLFRGSLI